MRRYSVNTTCPGTFGGVGILPGPVGPSNPPAFLNPTDAYFQDYTTADLDFTTELNTSIRNAKPRRPKAMARKSTFYPSTDIHKDHHTQSTPDPWLEQAAGPSANVPKDPIRRSSILLARPAQRMSMAPQQTAQEDTYKLRLTGISERPSRRRVSAILEERQAIIETRRLEPIESRRVSTSLGLNRPTESRRVSTSLAKSTTSNQLVKNPRRRTIYVPSEDTTIMTIHPGAPSQAYQPRRAKSPDLGLELVTLSEEETTDLVPAMRYAKGSRKSIALPPKRGVLQQRRRPSQSVTFAPIVPSTNTGKENVPPGSTYNLDIDLGPGKMEKPARVEAVQRHRPSVLQPRLSIINDQNTPPKGLKRVRMDLKVVEESPAKVLKSQPASTVTSQATTARAYLNPNSPFRTNKSPPSALRKKAPTMRSSTKQSPSMQRFPVLSDDLARPELYEDSWLDYQEAALSQLINNTLRLFDQTRRDREPADLRKALFEMYHEACVAQLHKRLHASLSYGALSIPDDVIKDSLRLKDDVGLRQRFLDLWVDSYDLGILKAVLEVVVGREVIISTHTSTGSVSTSSQCVRRRLRRGLEDFINAFVIRNEDAVKIKSAVGSIATIARAHEQHPDDFGSQRWSWRRTVLRSLMVILLLDRAKNANLITDCLFQATSEHKTSVSVLQSLAKMLLPSFGDITRPLAHIQYQVSHIQYLLQEHKYRVQNIATDLRDGVLLSRLVELVLFGPVQLLEQRSDTITITLPVGEILLSNINDDKNSWILSQHLKLPATSHAQRHYNVQVALSALRGVKGVKGSIASALDAVTAKDIVNGHREKTLGLLWAIVGRWGLKDLVNWKEVEKEIRCFRARYDEINNDNIDDTSDNDLPDHDDPSRYKVLLREWASSIARVHNLRLRNLTTSFADGRIFEAIVDEYLPFCKPSSPLAQDRSDHLIFTYPTMTLAEKLRTVGCSRAFIALFSANKHHPIPSKDFTLTSVAFLASRLIPLSISHRAAATIQRFYRTRLAREEVRRRVALMRLASHCAVVVRTRERVVGAAVVIQRKWRRCEERRMQRLRRDVTMFQSAARGWKVRARLGAGRGGMALGCVGAKSGSRSTYRAGW